MDLKSLEKEILNSKKPVLLEIWSSWCLPCQTIKFILEEFEEDYKDKIKILRTNSDLQPAVSPRYEVKGVPTFILFKEGQEIKRLVGARSKEQLISLIKEVL